MMREVTKHLSASVVGWASAKNFILCVVVVCVVVVFFRWRSVLDRSSPRFFWSDIDFPVFQYFPIAPECIDRIESGRTYMCWVESGMG